MVQVLKNNIASCPSYLIIVQDSVPVTCCDVELVFVMQVSLISQGRWLRVGGNYTQLYMFKVTKSVGWYYNHAKK